MNQTDILKDLLEHQYPQPELTHAINLSNIVLRTLPLPTVPLFMRYQNLQTLIITKCELINLQNFPKLVSLKQLDISENSLDGTLDNLMPLCQLNYLNIAHNRIHDYKQLRPLQTIEGLQIYLAGNPFADDQSWKEEVRMRGLKLAQQPRKLQQQSSECDQQEIVQQKKVEIQEIPMREPYPTLTYRQILDLYRQPRLPRGNPFSSDSSQDLQLESSSQHIQIDFLYLVYLRRQRQVSEQVQQQVSEQVQQQVSEQDIKDIHYNYNYNNINHDIDSEAHQHNDNQDNYYHEDIDEEDDEDMDEEDDEDLQQSDEQQSESYYEEEGQFDQQDTSQTDVPEDMSDSSDESQSED